jgi:hypothetical protein
MRAAQFLAIIGRGSKGSNALENTEDRAGATSEQQDNVINTVNSLDPYGPSWQLVPGNVAAGTVYAQVPNSGTGDLAFTRASTATRTNSAGNIVDVATGVPRIDYRNANGSLSPTGRLLLEPQRTNSFVRSEEFTSTSWLSGGGGAAVFTDNFGLSPSGNQTSSRWTAANLNSQVRQNVATINTTATLSIYMRTNTGTKSVNLFINDIAVTSTVTVTTSWQRFTLTGATGATLIGAGRCGFSNNSILTTTDYIEVWGAQYEIGAYATTFIKTTTAAVTRLADSASKTGVSSLIGQTEGTLFVEMKDLVWTASALRLIGVGVSDGTFNNRVALMTGQTSNTYRVIVTSGGTPQTSTTASGTFGNVKVALAYSSAGGVIYVNGTQVLSFASISVPSTSAVYLGMEENGNASSQPNGPCSQAALFKTRLTNAQLAQLTTL